MDILLEGKVSVLPEVAPHVHRGNAPDSQTVTGSKSKDSTEKGFHRPELRNRGMPRGACVRGLGQPVRKPCEGNIQRRQKCITIRL